jgi:hypothetical protein
MSGLYPCRLAAEGWQGQLFGQCLAVTTETSAPDPKVSKTIFHLRTKSFPAYLL